MATFAQNSYLKSLLEQRTAPSGLVATYSPEMPQSEASRLIDKLKKCPQKATATATGIVPEGFYYHGESYYKVQTSKTSGKRYAKIWTGSSWGYNAGGIYQLTLADKLTQEQAVKFGKKTGHCCVCSKLLTNPESVAAGIGPICADNMGW